MKTPYIRSQDADVVLVDNNLNVAKYLGIPIFENEPTITDLNNNDSSKPAIGFYNGSFIIWNGIDQWIKAGGGVKNISLPSPDYPGVILSDDGFTVTAILDDALKALLGTFEPDARLIINGLQSGIEPRFTYGVGNIVTSFIFDGALDAPGTSYKINFTA